MHNNENQKQNDTVVSDGSSASYYELPKHAAELQDLISHRNMNAQIGEIFRACYRYGQASHSDQLRDAKKIRFYADAEVLRLERRKLHVQILAEAAMLAESCGAIPNPHLEQATNPAPKSDFRKLPVFFILPNQSPTLSLLQAVSDTLHERFANKITAQECRLRLHEQLPNWAWRDIADLLRILYPNMEAI